MNILQTPARFYPYIGGTEQVCFNVCRQLVRLGHRVHVICADEPRTGSGVIENINVIRLPYISKIANTNITFGLPHYLLTQEYDIIHTHIPHPWSADISACAAWLKKKPLFLTYHNDIVGQGVNRFVAQGYNFTALRFLMRQARRIFITRREYFDYSGFLKPFVSKVIVTPPGIDFEKFKPLCVKKKDQPGLFFLGILDRYHRYKGLDFLLAALKALPFKFKPKLYIGGDGELVPYYRKIVDEMALSQRVVFLGKLSDQEVVEYYNMCDIFVLPSVSAVQEGYGLVALEAMACRKAVIVSDVVGVAEDVRRCNAGIVVASGNSIALKDAIVSMLSEPALIESMGGNGFKLVKDFFSWERHACIVEQEYIRNC